MQSQQKKRNNEIIANNETENRKLTEKIIEGQKVASFKRITELISFQIS